MTEPTPSSTSPVQGLAASSTPTFPLPQNSSPSVQGVAADHGTNTPSNAEVTPRVSNPTPPVEKKEEAGATPPIMGGSTISASRQENKAPQEESSTPMKQTFSTTTPDSRTSIPLFQLEGSAYHQAKRHIHRFYKMYNPSAPTDQKVDNAMEYDAFESVLFQKLYTKYNVTEEKQKELETIWQREDEEEAIKEGLLQKNNISMGANGTSYLSGTSHPISSSSASVVIGQKRNASISAQQNPAAIVSAMAGGYTPISLPSPIPGGKDSGSMIMDGTFFAQPPPQISPGGTKQQTPVHSPHEQQQQKSPISSMPISRSGKKRRHHHRHGHVTTTTTDDERPSSTSSRGSGSTSTTRRGYSSTSSFSSENDEGSSPRRRRVQSREFHLRTPAEADAFSISRWYASFRVLSGVYLSEKRAQKSRCALVFEFLLPLLFFLCLLLSFFVSGQVETSETHFVPPQFSPSDRGASLLQQEALASNALPPQALEPFNFTLELMSVFCEYSFYHRAVDKILPKRFQILGGLQESEVGTVTPTMMNNSTGNNRTNETSNTSSSTGNISASPTLPGNNVTNAEPPLITETATPTPTPVSTMPPLVNVLSHFPVCTRFGLQSQNDAYQEGHYSREVWSTDLHMGCLGDDRPGVDGSSFSTVTVNVTQRNPYLFGLPLGPLDFLCFHIPTAVHVVEGILATLENPYSYQELYEFVRPTAVPELDDMYLLRLLTRYLVHSGHIQLETAKGTVSGAGSRESLDAERQSRAQKDSIEASFFFGGTKIFLHEPTISSSVSNPLAAIQASSSYQLALTLHREHRFFRYMFGGFVLEPKLGAVDYAIEQIFDTAAATSGGRDPSIFTFLSEPSSSQQPVLQGKIYPWLDRCMRTEGDHLWSVLQVNSFTTTNVPSIGQQKLNVTIRVNQSTLPTTSSIIENVANYFSFASKVAKNSITSSMAQALKDRRKRAWYERYIASGFSTLHQAVVRAFGVQSAKTILGAHGANDSHQSFQRLRAALSNWTASPMPIPTHRNANYFVALGTALPLVLVLPQLLIIAQLTRNIRGERTTNIPAFLRTSCGVSDATMLLARIWPYIAVEFLYSVILALLGLGSFMQNTNVVLSFILLCLYHWAILGQGLGLAVLTLRVFPPIVGNNIPSSVGARNGFQKNSSSKNNKNSNNSHDNQISSSSSSSQKSFNYPSDFPMLIVIILLGLFSTSNFALPIRHFSEGASFAISSVLCQVSFGQASSALLESEITQQGMDWARFMSFWDDSKTKTFFTITNPAFSLQWVFFMLLINIGWYFLFAFCLHSTRLSRAFRDVFCCCCRRRKRKTKFEDDEKKQYREENSEAVTHEEEEEEEEQPVLQVKDVRVFGVRNLLRGGSSGKRGGAASRRGQKQDNASEELHAPRSTSSSRGFAYLIDDATFQVPQQTISALVVGSEEQDDGKTKLLQCVAGEIDPTDGNIEGPKPIFDEEYSAFLPGSGTGGVSYLPQGLTLWPWMSAVEALKTIEYLKRRISVDKKQFALADIYDTATLFFAGASHAVEEQVTENTNAKISKRDESQDEDEEMESFMMNVPSSPSPPSRHREDNNAKTRMKLRNNEESNNTSSRASRSFVSAAEVISARRLRSLLLTPCGELTTLQQQMLNTIAVFLCHPKLVILDGITSDFLFFSPAGKSLGSSLAGGDGVDVASVFKQRVNDPHLPSLSILMAVHSVKPATILSAQQILFLENARISKNSENPSNEIAAQLLRERHSDDHSLFLPGKAAMTTPHQSVGDTGFITRLTLSESHPMRHQFTSKLIALTHQMLNERKRSTGCDSAQILKVTVTEIRIFIPTTATIIARSFVNSNNRRMRKRGQGVRPIGVNKEYLGEELFQYFRAIEECERQCTLQMTTSTSSSSSRGGSPMLQIVLTVAEPEEIQALLGGNNAKSQKHILLHWTESELSPTKQKDFSPFKENNDDEMDIEKSSPLRRPATQPMDELKRNSALVMWLRRVFCAHLVFAHFRRLTCLSAPPGLGDIRRALYTLLLIPFICFALAGSIYGVIMQFHEAPILPLSIQMYKDFHVPVYDAISSSTIGILSAEEYRVSQCCVEVDQYGVPIRKISSYENQNTPTTIPPAAGNTSSSSSVPIRSWRYFRTMSSVLSGSACENSQTPQQANTYFPLDDTDYQIVENPNLQAGAVTATFAKNTDVSFENSMYLSKYMLANGPPLHSKYRMTSFQCGRRTTQEDASALQQTGSVFYNISAPHSVAEGFASMYYATLIRFLQQEISANVSVATYFNDVLVSNQPLPLSNYEKRFTDDIGSIVLSLLFACPFALPPALSFGFLLHRKFVCRPTAADGDRTHLILSVLITDLFSVLFPILLLFVCLINFEVTEYLGKGLFIQLVRVLMLHQLCLSLIGCILVQLLPSVLSKFFAPRTLQNVFAALVALVMGCSMMFAWMLLSSPSADRAAANVIRRFLRFIPSFCCGEVFLNLIRLPMDSFAVSFQSGLGASAVSQDVTGGGSGASSSLAVVGEAIWFLSAQAFVAAVVLVFMLLRLDFKLLRWCRGGCGNKKNNKKNEGDEGRFEESVTSSSTVKNTSSKKKAPQQKPIVEIKNVTLVPLLSTAAKIFRSTSAVGEKVMQMTRSLSSAEVVNAPGSTTLQAEYLDDLNEDEGMETPGGVTESSQATMTTKSAEASHPIVHRLSLSIQPREIFAFVDKSSLRSKSILAAIAGQLETFEVVPGMLMHHHWEEEEGEGGSSHVSDISIASRFHPLEIRSLSAVDFQGGTVVPVGYVASTHDPLYPWLTVDECILYFLLLRNPTSCFSHRYSYLARIKKLCLLTDDEVQQQDSERGMASGFFAMSTDERGGGNWLQSGGFDTSEADTVASENSIIGNRNVGSLSLLEHRKLAIACGLTSFPMVLCIENPLHGFNTTMEKEEVLKVLQQIRRYTQCTIVLTANNIRDIQHHVDRVAVLSSKDGSLQLVGDISDVYAATTSGYSLTSYHLHTTDADGMKRFVKGLFPGVNPLRDLHTLLVFRLPTHVTSTSSTAAGHGSRGALTQQQNKAFGGTTSEVSFSMVVNQFIRVFDELNMTSFNLASCPIDEIVYRSTKHHSNTTSRRETQLGAGESSKKGTATIGMSEWMQPLLHVPTIADRDPSLPPGILKKHPLTSRVDPGGGGSSPPRRPLPPWLQEFAPQQSLHRLVNPLFDSFPGDENNCRNDNSSRVKFRRSEAAAVPSSPEYTSSSGLDEENRSHHRRHHHHHHCKHGHRHHHHHHRTTSSSSASPLQTNHNAIDITSPLTHPNASLGGTQQQGQEEIQAWNTSFGNFSRGIKTPSPSSSPLTGAKSYTVGSPAVDYNNPDML